MRISFMRISPGTVPARVCTRTWRGSLCSSARPAVAATCQRANSCARSKSNGKSSFLVFLLAPRFRTLRWRVWDSAYTGHQILSACQIVRGWAWRITLTLYATVASRKCCRPVSSTEIPCVSKVGSVLSTSMRRKHGFGVQFNRFPPIHS